MVDDIMHLILDGKLQELKKKYQLQTKRPYINSNNLILINN